MPHDVLQIYRHDDRGQHTVTVYALGTQPSVWPQVCQSQFLENADADDESLTMFARGEPRQTVGTSDSSTYLTEQLQAALADYDSVVNNLRQKFKVVASESRKGPRIPDYHAAIQLLRSWRMGDEQEQRETLEFLKQALDEDRLSDRKLFP